MTRDCAGFCPLGRVTRVHRCLAVRVLAGVGLGTAGAGAALSWQVAPGLPLEGRGLSTSGETRVARPPCERPRLLSAAPTGHRPHHQRRQSAGCAGCAAASVSSWSWPCSRSYWARASVMARCQARSPPPCSRAVRPYRAGSRRPAGARRGQQRPHARAGRARGHPPGCPGRLLDAGQQLRGPVPTSAFHAAQNASTASCT